LWGPFWTIFVYQALNVYGWIVWTNEQHDAEVATAGSGGGGDRRARVVHDGAPA
jgi:hypothetical protein